MSLGQERIPVEISPDILDTIGKEFKFRHGKGTAEWLKNALDNYLRLREAGKEPLSGRWPVLINMIDGPSRKNGPNIAVIDFGGTTLSSVSEFFLYWGSRSAASHGGASSRAALTGGHGNGGKFYMREMWDNGARFCTWHDGKVASLIVDRERPGTSGYWERKDQPVGWRDAFRSALPASEGLGGGDDLIAYLDSAEPEIVRQLDSKERGFSIVVGRRARVAQSANDVVRGAKWDRQKLVDEIRDAPQARRPIRELAISVFANGVLQIERLAPEMFEEDPDWPVEAVTMPREVIVDPALIDARLSAGELTVRKAASQLKGRLKHLNAVFVVDKAGNPIATYPIDELPFTGHSTLSGFVYGELALTFPGVDNFVENDRERLHQSPTTTSIIRWTVEQIWSQLQVAEEAERDNAKNSDLQVATILNDALNEHAKRFLQELQTQILVDYIPDETGGGPGGVGVGTGPFGPGPGGTAPRTGGKGGGEGAGGTKGVEGTSDRLRRARFPQVLLSGYDPDPARGDGQTKYLTERHPPLEQDDKDKQSNVWWINTEHPFAKVALERGGPYGHAFRNHQLSMFREVVQREALRLLQRRESELALDRVENELTEVSNTFLAEIPYDLISKLLDDVRSAR